MRLVLAALLAGCSSSPAPQKCAGHAECPDGRCVHGTCKAGSGADGSTCEYRAECASDYCVDGVCASGKLGAVCIADFHCDSRYCYGRRCATDNVGAKCEVAEDCNGEGVICIEDQCRRRGGRQATCQSDDHCLEGLSCVDATCMNEEDQARRIARREEEARKAAEATNNDMLAQSGVKPETTQAERSPLPPGRGQRVRTAKVTAKGRVFAACRPDERLVGGGCSEEVASFPSEFSAEDTVGARWNCVASSIQVTAYALCMKLP